MEQIPSAYEDSYEHLLLGTLATGERVYDKPESHLHAGIEGFVREFLPRIQASGKEFIEASFRDPRIRFPARRVSIDPAVDDLFLAQRKGRKGYTVFVRNRNPGTTDNIVIVLRRSDAYPEGITPVREGSTLATAFGGEQAAREPWDPWFDKGDTPEERERRGALRAESLQYWRSNALIPSSQEYPIIEGSERPFSPDLLTQIIDESKSMGK